MLMCSPRDQGNIIELMAVPNTNVYVPDYSKKIKQDKLVDSDFNRRHWLRPRARLSIPNGAKVKPGEFRLVTDFSAHNKHIKKYQSKDFVHLDFSHFLSKCNKINLSPFQRYHLRKELQRCCPKRSLMTPYHVLVHVYAARLKSGFGMRYLSLWCTEISLFISATGSGLSGFKRWSLTIF